jgi:hypothetical protein
MDARANGRTRVAGEVIKSASSVSFVLDANDNATRQRMID